jgi:hypothetical protein
MGATPLAVLMTTFIAAGKGKLTLILFVIAIILLAFTIVGDGANLDRGSPTKDSQHFSVALGVTFVFASLFIPLAATLIYFFIGGNGRLA